MYLKSLELFGFKSFPEKTILKFEPGIVVIVGPNGCGKSNLLDAIKWALGEQSPKSLRGSKMEDVIFNGTENYPPLNYAEVTLVFSNEDKYLPIEYEEVSITRRLFRSGESQYFLNKNPVRLKDIQDLFLGTGIGETTYSFIEQGKIEVFLNYKPEEKRLLFDEASGIIKYKEKRKETLKKLEETENNLMRLEDIIGEVKRQINYLEKQVEKAKRYKEIESQLIEVEKKIATLKCKELERKTNEVLEEIKDLKNKEEKENESLEESKSACDELNKELAILKEDVEKLNSQIFSLESQKKVLQNKMELNRKRISEIKERIKNIEEREGEIEKDLIQQDEKIAKEKESFFLWQRQKDNLERTIQKIKEEKKEKEREKQNLGKEMVKKREEILFKEEEKIKINNQLIELDTHLKDLSARKRRLFIDQERLEGFFKEKEKDLREQEESLASLRRELIQLIQKREDLEEDLQKYEKREKEIFDKKLEKEKELVELSFYEEFLKNLELKYEINSFSDKVKIIFEELPSSVNRIIASLDKENFLKKEDGYIYEIEAKLISFHEEDIKEEKRIREVNLKDLDFELEKISQKKEELNRLLKEKIEEILYKEKRIGEEEKEKENIAQQFFRIKEEKELIEVEIKEVTREIEEIEDKKKILEKDKERINEELSRLNDVLKEIERRKEILTLQINEQEKERVEKETELKSLEKSKEEILKRQTLLEEVKKRLLEEKENMREEKEERRKQIEKIEKEIKEDNEKIFAIEKKIGELEREKNILKERNVSLEKQIGQVEKELEIKRGNLQKIREALYEKKLEINNFHFEQNKIIDYLKQVYQIDFVPLERVEEDLKALMEERKRLKKLREELGEVNLVAIEEFEDLNKRYKFLEEQRRDLLHSKEELRRMINKINKISQENFLSTFNKIREEFKRIFRYLFGGGKAEIVLLDKNDILECGIDIEVQPPGKKLQNISLLSGGEKALSTIALLFAIFKVRPSPLCILDEIDAPLDEANVDRFNGLLKEFAKTSQFIVITHNKVTMSNADILYGVTMQERGVSKLVSVKFAKEVLS